MPKKADKPKSPAIWDGTTPPPVEERFISRVRAATVLDCSVQLIDKYIREGKLPAYRLGRKVIVRRLALLQLLREVPRP